jgi:hypothetical protein
MVRAPVGFSRLPLVAVLAVAALACSLGNLLGGPPPNPSAPPAIPVSPLPPAPEPVPGIYVNLVETTVCCSDRSEITVGQVAAVSLTFEPSLFQVLLNDAGEPTGESVMPWEPEAGLEMRLCMTLHTVCEPGVAWLRFAAAQDFDVPVDWLGPRTLWLAAEFRQVDGASLPSHAYAGQLAARTEDSIEIVGILDESIALEDQPAQVQTAVSATRAAYPVIGSVVIEDGRCCAGGTASDTIELQAAFSASSPFGEITEMRLVLDGGACKTEAEMDAVPWEPFAPARTFTVAVVSNWVGHTTSAQFRDSAGNLSPVFCDDISVEGEPAPPAL